MTFSKLGRAHDGLMAKIAILLITLFMKIIPFFAMMFFIVSLARTLRQAGQRRRQMLANQPVKQATNASPSAQRRGSSGAAADQKTRILLAIMICYFASILLFGISMPLVIALGNDFKTNVFDPLCIVFELFGFINSVATFVLLISMSQLFRETFWKLFWPDIGRFRRFSPTSSGPSSSENRKSNLPKQREPPLSVVISELEDRVVDLDA